MLISPVLIIGVILFIKRFLTPFVPLSINESRPFFFFVAMNRNELPMVGVAVTAHTGD